MEETKQLAIEEISEDLSLTEALDAVLQGDMELFAMIFNSFCLMGDAILSSLKVECAPFGRSSDIE